MRKKRVMVIGPGRSGKTTLVNALNDCEAEPRRTADMIYGKNTIDVPGSYIENAWMYKHIIAAAQDASKVVIVLDQSRCIPVYPPNFAKIFRCPVIGVITKCDLAEENKEKCFKQLRQIGVREPYYSVSFPTGTGLKELKEALFGNRKEGEEQK